MFEIPDISLGTLLVQVFIMNVISRKICPFQIPVHRSYSLTQKATTYLPVKLGLNFIKPVNESNVIPGAGFKALYPVL